MALRVYNTLGRAVQTFEPLEEGKVRMYVCGPTVYADAHIGHAMSAIVFDMIRRYLEYIGYAVTYVTNFTDVDDKIIDRARATGQDPFALAEHYTQRYLAHLQELNVKAADEYTRVTTEMPRIIADIQELGEAGYAYELNGSVYFRVRKDDDYGKLSQRKREEARTGTRVEAGDVKEDAADFALWKKAKAGEPSWPSPWGPGRPGWHIECTSMCRHHLGDSIDIHGGGNDLIFPHHENEIAQSESLTGQPFARYWIHNGMMQLAGTKMSKSLGNLIAIQDFLAQREADALRMVVFQGHYRKPVQFSDDIVNAAQRGLERIKQGLQPATGQVSTGDAAHQLREAAETARVAFRQRMDDDFNTSAALAAIFDLVRAINTARAQDVGGVFFDTAQAAVRELMGVLGFVLPASVRAWDATDDLTRQLVELLIETRAQLRQAKAWALADRVRDRLLELGIGLEDQPQGTTWHRVA